MTTRFPPPRDQAPHLRAGQMREVLELGAIQYDTRNGSVTPNPGNSIAVSADQPARTNDTRAHR